MSHTSQVFWPHERCFINSKTSHPDVDEVVEVCDYDVLHGFLRLIQVRQAVEAAVAHLARVGDIVNQPVGRRALDGGVVEVLLVKMDAWKVERVAVEVGPIVALS